MGKQTEIIFIRHGETEFNKANLFFGHMDPGLNETGKKQLINTREILRNMEGDIEEVFCSPLKRCVESMKILELNENMKKSMESSFMELNFGIFEGKTYGQIRSEYPDAAEEMRNNWRKFKAEGGESLEDLLDRAVKKTEEIMDRYRNRKILIISHAGVIKTILSHYLYGNLDGYWKLKVDNGSISKICRMEDGYVFADYINRL